MGGKPVRFLDPAVGSGSFFSALCQESSPNSIASAVGIELDPLFAKSANDLWATLGLEIVQGDFTQHPIPERPFSIIISRSTKKHASKPDLDNRFRETSAALPDCIAISCCYATIGCRMAASQYGSSLLSSWM
jgi:hypothetical protein